MRVVRNIRAGRKAGYAGLRRRQGEDPRAAAACRGQVHAVAQMVEDDVYCIDVLTQISAATSALKAVSVMLVDDHLNHCVRQAAAEGGEVADEKLSEVEKVISRLVRS